jgi:N-methylhydantoinase A
VCYGRGGTRPTVTDAALVLGLLDPAFFLGGRMPLDRDSAAAAIDRDVAAPLGRSTEEAAAAIMELATEHMVQAILDITVNQGIDPTHATFVAGGGAAGLNCVAIARRLGCRRIMVPETGAALSAAGALLSDLSTHFHAVFHTTSRSFDRAGVNAILARLHERCDDFAAGPGSGACSTTVAWSSEARYPDQAWEIDVPLRRDRFDGDADVEALVGDFHDTHQEIFAVSDRSSAVEAVSWSAEVRCRVGPDTPGRLVGERDGAALHPRRVYFPEAGFRETEVYRMDLIGTGEVIAGPAMIESSFTSIAVDPGARARRCANGTLMIDARG